MPGTEKKRAADADRIVDVCLKDRFNRLCCFSPKLRADLRSLFWNQDLQALWDQEIHGLFNALKDLCDPFCSMAQWLAAGPNIRARSASHLLGLPDWSVES